MFAALKKTPLIESFLLLWEVSKPYYKEMVPVVLWQSIYYFMDTLYHAYIPFLIGLATEQRFADAALLIVGALVFRFLMLIADVKMHWNLHIRVTENIGMRMINDQVARLSQLGEAFFASVDDVKLYDRTFTRPKSIVDTLHQVFWGLIVRGMLIMYSLTLIGIVNPLAIPIILVTITAFMVALVRMEKGVDKPRKHYEEMDEATKRYTGALVRGYPTLNRHGVVGSYQTKIAELFLQKKQFRVQQLFFWTTRKGGGLVRDDVLILGLAALASLSIWQLSNGLISLSTVMLVLSIGGNIFDLMWQLGDVFKEVTQEKETCLKLLSIRKMPPTLPPPTNVLPVPAGSLEFEGSVHVTPLVVGLDDSVKLKLHERQILQIPYLKIGAGEHIAFVGATGSGKTTLAKVLARLLSIDESSTLKINGVSMHCVDPDQIRSRIAMVSQDVWVPNGTLKQALLIGELDEVKLKEFPEEMLWQVLEQAQLAEEVRRWDKGLETLVGQDGRHLSGGERQRLEIARTLLRMRRQRIDLLVIDEGTSALDTKTELKVQSALDTLVNGQTAIVIAHRLSTIKNCDRIFVMHRGKIVEVGTHEELLAKQGKYYDLYTAQKLK